MWSIQFTCVSSDEIEPLSAELFELGCGGTEERADSLLAYFDDGISPETVSHLLPAFPYKIERLVPPALVIEANDRDPILIGKRFVLVPADRIVLPIDAGMAFGSGRHETTQLCLEAMERFIGPGETIYDVGCGSGILALAAIKLGAGCVVATDIDEAAIRNARAHFPGPLFIGSADGFRSHSADVVISNITGRVNDEIARDLKRIVKPAGLVIICGFTTETAPGLFRPHETLSLNEWQCWICKPADISEADGVSLQTHDPVWWL